MVVNRNKIKINRNRMGNQVGDLHPPGYSDEEKFQFVENMMHPFLGQIQILRLAKKPKSINTQNPIIQSASEN